MSMLATLEELSLECSSIVKFHLTYSGLLVVNKGTFKYRSVSLDHSRKSVKLVIHPLTFVKVA